MTNIISPQKKSETQDFDSIFSDICAEAQKYKVANIWSDITKSKDERPVVLYGAGGYCFWAFHFCAKNGIEVACVCDSFKTGTYFHRGKQYKLISPDALLRDYPDARILITSLLLESEIKHSLLKLGIAESHIYSRSQAFSQNDFAAKYLEGYRWAWKYFDEHSRGKVLGRMRVYLCGVLVKADSPYKDGYWVWPGIELGSDEVFVDGGAYNGDSIYDFINAVGDRYRAIYAFEPDGENYRAAVNVFSRSNLHFFNKGLWSTETELCFDAQNSEISRFTDSGEQIISVTSIDAVFAGKSDDELPTLIKMDIEGAEKEALLGASETIRRKKPKLAICAYHKPEDIYELPQTILKLRDDYRLSLWQMGERVTDTILYAT
ncbi:MAG: FkbM family methyltransferase [Holophagales bacterium]|jgi:FkbM family methyltransferase|nr:FkbM family methyltransferase [Holophagales bacterium]